MVDFENFMRRWDDFRKVVLSDNIDPAVEKLCKASFYAGCVAISGDFMRVLVTETTPISPARLLTLISEWREFSQKIPEMFDEEPRSDTEGAPPDWN